jgi:hypothetical protein
MARTVSLGILDQVSIASPCPMRWEDMRPVDGGERIRHCHQCDLHVYNFSNMSREDAEALVLNKQGRFCAGFFRRPDGTIITRDCPVGLRAARAKVAKAAARIAAAIALLVTGGLSFGAGSGGRERGLPRLSTLEPFVSIRERLRPSLPTVRLQQQQMAFGEICVPSQLPALPPQRGAQR